MGALLNIFTIPELRQKAFCHYGLVDHLPNGYIMYPFQVLILDEVFAFSIKSVNNLLAWEK